MLKETQIRLYQLIELTKLLDGGSVPTFLCSILATGGLMERLLVGKNLTSSNCINTTLRSIKLTNTTFRCNEIDFDLVL